jgi:hypothetical protein
MLKAFERRVMTCLSGSKKKEVAGEHYTINSRITRWAGPMELTGEKGQLTTFRFLKKYDVGVRIGFMWFKIWTSSG